MIRTLSVPVLYSLELTAACNNQCPGCYNVFAADRMHSPPALPVDHWRTILSRIQPHAHLVKLTGGEPTLYPYLDQLIALLDALEIGYTLFTNARWPDPAHLIEVLRNSRSFRGLLISLHGATARTHEAFSGVVGSFQEAVTNTRMAADACLPVTLSTVIHQQNLAELEAMPALCAELGVDHVSFNRYLGPHVSSLTPSPEQLKEAIARIEGMRARGAKVRLGNCIPQCFVPSSSTGCLAGVAYCTVDPWGNVRPCNHAGLHCGNLLEQTVENIWNGEAMTSWRSGIPPACHRCAAFSRCHGGCGAQAGLLGRAGDPLMVGALDAPQRAEKAELGLAWRPLFVGDIRPERFGYVALWGNHVVPMTHAGLSVVQMCNGQHTLQVLNERFGQPGLKLIYELHRQGIIEMQN